MPRAQCLQFVLYRHKPPGSAVLSRAGRRRGGRGVRGARPQLVSRLLGADKGRGVEVVVDLRDALPAHTGYCIDIIYYLDII